MRRSSPGPRLLALAAFAALTGGASRGAAFCGFYVAGADAKLYADATQVVLMREGTRTVLSMQNDYKGPPEAFAMVIPVPVVLAKENVKTLPREVFAKVDELGAPRLVEYWEQDPCRKGGGVDGLGSIGGLGLSGIGFGGGGRGDKDLGVTIEAKFSVAEYEIVVLSAKDSGGLDTWLRQEKYAIPPASEPYFRPYVQSGSKFFVAKVDPKKVTFEDGRATLSPLRFHYDAESFTLPIRLGLVNSAGVQDLIVDILAKRTRYEVANYPNVMIPTNLDVAETARASFGEFYAALFDATIAKTKNAVVTEYAWDAGTCDPCPGPTLDGEDLATLGADVIPGGTQGLTRGGGGSFGRSGRGATVRAGKISVSPGLPEAVVSRIFRQQLGVLRRCYDEGLRANPTLGGTVDLRFTIPKSGEVAAVSVDGQTSDLTDATVRSCITKRLAGRLTFPTPENGAEVKVGYAVVFAPAGADAGAAPPPPRFFGGMGGATPYVLTRLHLRYAKDAIGEDLVFRTAPPVAGGREVRAEGGELEKGSRPDATNNFQARYAIRHPWTGPVACKDPVRGVWGGPPPGDAGPDLGGAPPPLAARKTAFAPRGNVRLASMLKGADGAAIGEPSPVTGATDADAGADGDAGAGLGATSGGRGCGSCAAGATGGPGPGDVARAAMTAAAVVLVGSRRRGRERRRRV